MTDWTEIEQARAKAHAKHGDNSIEGITADDPRWLSILAEEGGETSEATLLAWNALLQARLGRVAHEQTYDATGSLRGELIDVLAVASAWLDALDGRTTMPTAAGVLHEIVTRIDEARYANGETTSPWGNTDVRELLAHLRQPFTEGGETSVAGDEHHTLDELYDYRLLYNALAANEWAAHGTYPVVKSWRHSDGEECFGGGWFIVVATLPTGQVSNHYAAEHWELFAVPAVATPPEYDGHDPADAARRMRALLSHPTPTTDT
ncbi:WDGH domain-containing protein [Curtobacterium sp. 22159]|uniref:WDGH domain-containing protein n=1 Tax=Curtobacterium sp. 22159 TaxID=3453882 RepID=UPI003F863DE5